MNCNKNDQSEHYSVQSPVYRNRVPALLDASAIYQALAALEIGQIVPSQIYIADYATGEIPGWQVGEREQTGEVLRLVLVDPRPAPGDTGMLRPALQVLTCERITLATGMFMWEPEQGYGPSPRQAAMLHDLLHEAKLANQRHRRARKAPERIEKEPVATLWEIVA